MKSLLNTFLEIQDADTISQKLNDILVMLRESLMQNEIINSSIYRKPTFECGVIAVK